LTTANIYSQVKYLLRCHDIYHNDTQHNDIQHKNKLKETLSIMTQRNGSVVMMGIIYAQCHKQTYNVEYHYAECHYAKSRYAECHYA
jgi:hypothetical protein